MFCRYNVITKTKENINKGGDSTRKSKFRLITITNKQRFFKMNSYYFKKAKL
uniref:hypothetical protein n=1 Tax=Roseburia hominis TaxID=301301 RepID=UPI001F2D3300